MSNGLFPKLRFPEFRGDSEWQLKRLGEITDHLLEKVNDSQMVPVSISAGVGFVAQVAKFGRDISGAQYKNYIRLQRGDFSYNKGNSKRYPQGCVYELKEFEEAAAPNAFISFRFRDGYVNRFFQPQFEMNFHGGDLARFITSGARADGLLNVSPEEFFSVRLPVPPSKAEQEKVADCLTSLDQLIAAEERKLDFQRVHKRGMMQILFPRAGQTNPHLRFPEFHNAPDWESKPLKSICVINPPHGGLPYEFVYIDLESVVSGLLTKRSKLEAIGAPSRAQRLLQNGDTIFQIVRPYQRNNLFVDFAVEEAFVASTGYAQLRPLGDPMFLYQAVHHDLFVEKVIEKCTGSSYPAINAADLGKVVISLPPDEAEERCVASCLASLDAMLLGQKRKVDILKAHKRGLMQGLFPTRLEDAA